MAYWVKRIMLKSGELITEKELRPDENRFEGEHPLLGEVITVACRGRCFKAEVVAGPPRNANPPGTVILIRVQEI
jgi:hypothetical protein